MTSPRRCDACRRKMAGPGDIRIPRDGLMVCTQCNEKEFLMPPGVTRTTLAGRRVTAHGGGDGKDLRHCVFCGSGGIVGRSDGTTECTLCQSVFSVQVQPRQPFAPQTVNGEPQHIPGMPNSPGGDQAPTDAAPVDSSAGTDEPGDATVGVPGFSDDEMDSFRTDEGAEVDRTAMVQNLALKIAGGRRDKVLRSIRQMNQRTR